MPTAHANPSAHSISIVIPVYRGANTLLTLMAEILPLAQGFKTPRGRDAVIGEVILVNDHGPDNSAAVMRQLAGEYPFVRPVWLSRNYGQHAATLAGIASSGGEWIATIDEDGQFDPGQIGTLLDAAMDSHAALVYAQPVNAAPHPGLRNVTSKTSKRIIDIMTGSKSARKYHSFRLMLGEVGRAVAAYAGSGVYLDVALGWVAGEAVTAPVTLRDEGDRPSGYNYRRLMSHFWAMVLTSGTRGLRAVGVTGFAIALLGILAAVFLTLNRLLGGVWPETWPQGWASLMVTLLILSGVMLLSLGIVAEYLGVAVNQAMGKPPYLIVSDAADGPLGRTDASIHWVSSPPES